MGKAEFISADQAVAKIENGSTLCAVAMSLVSSAESILKKIERSFLEKGYPKNLKFVHSCGQSNRTEGLAHLAHEGLLKQIIGGHWGLCPPMMDLISSDKVEAYCLPQGQMANMYHSMALREPGKISKIGLGTFIDPRIEGGKMNPRTKVLDDIVDVVTLNGEEYLMYKEIPIDVLLIRGTYADEDGNISTEEEAMMLEVLPAVMATKRFGGKVICQVKQVVKSGTLGAKNVTVPGVFVDYVVVCEDPFADHKQSSSWYYDPSYSGQQLGVIDATAGTTDLTLRKIIGRRAMMATYPNSIINVGTGIPNDVIGSIIDEEKVADVISITVESGIYGGVPAGGIDFGVSKNAQALIGHDRQFEYYNGAGVDITFMGAGEMDEKGNVNATKMGSKAPGAGGFIDITTMAKCVVFCSTFTGVGLKANFNPTDGLHITQEGSIRKLVKEVQQISYNGKLAAQRGQKMFYVTERAVFQLVPEGVMLIEVAKGIDLQKDVLDQMDFKPILSPNLKEINTDVYKDGIFDLKSIINANKE